MKIDTNLPNTPSTGAVAPAMTGRGATKVTPRPQAIQPHGPAADHAIGDALAIARISQSVIQRAISIALRLKSIAANAIATGDVDRRALAETVSEMGSALGERVGVAPPALSAPATTPREVSGVAMGEEFGMLRDAASGIEGMGTPQSGMVDGALQRLDDAIIAYTRRGIGLLEGMPGTAPAAAEETAMPAALATRARSAMESNPAAALKAQGNLTAAAVGRLTA